MATATTAGVRGLVGLWLWLLTVAVAGAQEFPGPLRGFLQQQMHLSPGDFVAVRQGQVVTTLPDTRDPRQVAAFGLVRVNGRGTALVDALLDIDAYLRNDAVLQGGRFSEVPTLADVTALTLQEDDLDELRHCRVGRCGLKLSAAMIERFRTEVRWAAPGWRHEATTLFRQMLVDYVGAYLRDGSGAMVEYADKPARVRLADETHALVRESPYLRDTVPELLDHLGQPSPPSLPNLRHVIYWAKEDFGFKPTITVSHLTIYEPATGPVPTVFVMSRQLYATHYFDASVAFTIASAVAIPQAPPAFHMLHLSRSRIDTLGGGFNAFKRFAASRRIRRWIGTTLRHAKAHIEGQASGGER
jgi:hypothetical protein